MKRTGMRDAIRGWVRGKRIPRTAREIADGIGRDHEKVMNALNGMVKVGHFTVSGGYGQRVYTEVRRPRVAMTRAQRLAKRAQEARDQRAAAGAIPRTVRKARREAVETANRRERARQANARLATQALREQRAAQRLNAQLVAMAAEAARRSAKEPPKPKPGPPPVETVDQWMARTGQQPQQLCWSATSQPFKTIVPDNSAINRRQAA